MRSLLGEAVGRLEDEADFLRHEDAHLDGAALGVGGGDSAGDAAVAAPVVARGAGEGGLLAALDLAAGNVREAAKLLGISRGGFYVKLKKLGLNPDEYR